MSDIDLGNRKGNAAWEYVRSTPDLITVRFEKLNLAGNEDGLKEGTVQTSRPGDPAGVRYKEVPISFGDPNSSWVGMNVYQGFRNRNPQDPFLILIPSSVDTDEFEPFIPAPILYWYAEQTNFLRQQAWISDAGASFNYEAMIDKTAPSGGRFDRWLEAYRLKNQGDRLEVPDTPGTENPREYLDYYGSLVELALGITGGEYETWYDENIQELDTETQTRQHDISYAEALSYCIVGDFIYLELFIDIETLTITDETEEDYDNHTRTLLLCIPADPDGAVEVEFSVDLDLLVEDAEDFADRALRTDLVVTGGRVAVLYDSVPYLYHFDALDGSDVQVVDLSTIWVSGNTLDLLSPCIGDRWIKIFGDSGKIWFGSDGYGVTCVDLATNSVLWTQAEGNTVWHPIGFCGGNLICAYETKVYETVTDYELPVDEWDGDLVAVPRVELARGFSHQAGIVSVNPLTGVVIGSSLFPGTVVGVSLSDSIADYYVDAASEIWNPQPNEAFPDPGGISFQLAVTPDFASVKDFYGGVLNDPYQDENLTGTYLEGAPAGVGNPGIFQGITANLNDDVNQPFGTYGWEVTWELDTEAQLAARNGRPGGIPPLSDLENTLANIEGVSGGPAPTRHSNGDWIRAEMWATSHNQLALWLVANHYLTTNPDDSQAVTFLKIDLSYRETHDQSSEYLGGVTITNPLDLGIGKPIPYPTPAWTDAVAPGWCEEFKSWHRSRTGPSDVSPWEGYYTPTGFDYAGSEPTGGLEFGIDQRQVWREIHPQIERLKTSEPEITLGPTCYTGQYLVLGPRYEASKSYTLQWQAYNAVGGLAWTQEINKPGTVVGPPIALSIPGEKVGVFTGYQDGTKHYICVLDGETGAVLYDDEHPSTGVLKDMMFGDSAIWNVYKNLAAAVTTS